MLKKIGILSIVAGVLVLSACSSKLTGTVTRFHQLPEPRGEHVEVAAMTPQLQNSIEFSFLRFFGILQLKSLQSHQTKFFRFS